MDNNEDFNLEETLRKDVDEIIKKEITKSYEKLVEKPESKLIDMNTPTESVDGIIFQKAEMLQKSDNYEDPLKKFENKNDFELTFAELNEKISLLRIRCGHYFITHNFEKCLELEMQLKYLITIRNKIIE